MVWCQHYHKCIRHHAKIAIHTDDQGDEGSDAKKAAMEEVHDKLSATWVDLNKASKAAYKLVEAVAECDTPKGRLTASAEDLTGVLEATETHLSDLNFMMRFKKLRDGRALTIHLATNKQNAAAENLTDVLNLMKQVKALMPKAAKTS